MRKGEGMQNKNSKSKKHKSLHTEKRWKSFWHMRSRTLNTFLILFLITVSSLLPATADAAALKIVYGGKTYNYTGSQAKASIGGKNINLDKTPGIIIDNTCLLPAELVFKKALGASYTYDKSTKKITIEQNNREVVLKLNSKTAYINGTKKTLDAAPRNIKFVKEGKTRLFVPSRFVAEALGYKYVWNASKKTAQMTEPFVIKYASDWVVYTGTQGGVTVNGTKVDLGDMPSIILNNTALLRAELIFKNKLGTDYSYDEAAKKVVIAKNNVSITMTINSKTAKVNGASKTMGTAARVVTNKSTGDSYVMVPGEFVASNLGYNYSWNASSKLSIIKEADNKSYFVQKWDSAAAADANMITEISGRYSNNTDIISITGLSKLDYSVSESDDLKYLYIDFRDIYKENSAFSTNVEGKFVHSVSIDATEEGLRLKIEKQTDCSYYTKTSGNDIEIIFCEDKNAEIGSVYQLKLSLPEGVAYHTVKDTDQYYNKRFVIKIPGDYIDYYKKNSLVYDKSVISSATVKLSGSYTVITVKTKKLQGYKLYDCGDYIGVKVGNPSSIYKNIVVLDPGHGGGDVGTSKSGVYEKDLNLQIIYTMAKKYFNSTSSDIKAYWTRTTDVKPSLQDRAAFAASVEADVFISLHMNSASSSASGTEVLYASNNKNEMSDMNSKAMANIFQNYLVSELDTDGRKIVDRTGLYVLKYNTVPAILIELGFLSNKNDFALLTDEDFQDLAAKTIYDATVKMFKAYPTGR